MAAIVRPRWCATFPFCYEPFPALLLLRHDPLVVFPISGGQDGSHSDVELFVEGTDNDAATA